MYKREPGYYYYYKSFSPCKYSKGLFSHIWDLGCSCKYYQESYCKPYECCNYYYDHKKKCRKDYDKHWDYNECDDNDNYKKDYDKHCDYNECDCKDDYKKDYDKYYDCKEYKYEKEYEKDYNKYCDSKGYKYERKKCKCCYSRNKCWHAYCENHYGYNCYKHYPEHYGSYDKDGPKGTYDYYYKD